MSRPIGTADELERRRTRAVQAVADGQPRHAVATVLAVHVKTVSRWVRAARRPGGLTAKPHLSAIRAVTRRPVAARPNLSVEVFDHAVHAEQGVAFLADRHRRLGARTVVRDRGAIHDKSGPVRARLPDHLGVVTEKFPSYAPDLNPDEGVWGWTKYGRRSDLAADDTDELWDHVIDELVTVKHSPRLLKAFIRETRLPGLSKAAT